MDPTTYVHQGEDGTIHHLAVLPDTPDELVAVVAFPQLTPHLQLLEACCHHSWLALRNEQPDHRCS